MVALKLIQPTAHSECGSEFERLVERTRRRAYSCAYHMTGNRDDAEDLTQEAYLRAFRSFASYDRSVPFEKWYFRILRNLFIDLLRRRCKLRTLSLNQWVGDDAEGPMLLQLASEEANPECVLMDQQIDERLQRALEALPAVYRRAVLLCDVEGYSYEEISQIMRSSLGTVRSRIHRGRSLLRLQMEALSSVQDER